MEFPLYTLTEYARIMRRVKDGRGVSDSLHNHLIAVGLLAYDPRRKRHVITQAGEIILQACEEVDAMFNEPSDAD